MEIMPREVVDKRDKYPLTILRVTALKLTKKWLQEIGLYISKWREMTSNTSTFNI